MLVFSRVEGDRIIIGDKIVVKVVRVRGDRVHIGIEAPREIPVDREEVHKSKLAEREASEGS